MLKQQSTKSIQAQVLYFTQDMSYFNLDTMILGARRPPRLCKSVYLNPSNYIYIYTYPAQILYSLLLQQTNRLKPIVLGGPSCILTIAKHHDACGTMQKGPIMTNSNTFA